MNIRERVNELLAEDCKDKLEQFNDLELHQIFEHTLGNDGCGITKIGRNSRCISVVELEILKKNGSRYAFSLAT